MGNNQLKMFLAQDLTPEQELQLLESRKQELLLNQTKLTEQEVNQSTTQTDSTKNNNNNDKTQQLDITDHLQEDQENSMLQRSIRSKIKIEDITLDWESREYILKVLNAALQQNNGTESEEDLQGNTSQKQKSHHLGQNQNQNYQYRINLGNIINQMQKQLKLTDFINGILKALSQNILKRQKQQDEMMLQRLKEVAWRQVEGMFEETEKYYQEKTKALLKRITMAERKCLTKVKEVKMKMKQNDAKLKKKQSMYGKDDQKSKCKIIALEKQVQFMKQKCKQLEKDYLKVTRQKLKFEKRSENLKLKINSMEFGMKSLNNKFPDFGLQSKLDQEVALSKNMLKAEKASANNQQEEQKPSEELQEMSMQKTESAPARSQISQLIEITAPVVKKRRTRKKKGAQGPRPASDGSADDSVVLLAAFNNILECLQNYSYKIYSRQLQHSKNPFLDQGYVFYPYFSKLIVNFTEMAPMLQRNYNIQGLFTYTQMFLKIAHFGIKTQVMGEQPENLSEQDLRHLRKLDADSNTWQEHLNEIYLLKPKDPQRKIQVKFIPITDFWLQKLQMLKKISGKSKNKKAGGKSQKDKPKTEAQIQKQQKKQLKKIQQQEERKKDAEALKEPKELFENQGINIYFNTKVQSELLQIFKQFIDKSEFWLQEQEKAGVTEEKDQAQKKKGVRKFSTKMDPSLSILFRNRKKLAKVAGLEKLKFESCVKSKVFGAQSNYKLFQTRINICLLYLLLACNEKDYLFALYTLKEDLDSEHYDLRMRLKQYFLQQNGVEILSYLLRSPKQQTICLNLVIRILHELLLEKDLKQKVLGQVKRLGIREYLLDILGYPQKKNIELGKRIIIFLCESDATLSFKNKLQKAQIVALQEFLGILKHHQLYPGLQKLLCKILGLKVEAVVAQEESDIIQGNSQGQNEEGTKMMGDEGDTGDTGTTIVDFQTLQQQKQPQTSPVLSTQQPQPQQQHQ